VALVAAADRFQPHRGVPFSAFAVPTISGALKRYLRDHRWALRTPRSLTEMHLRLRTAAEELTHHLGRAPNVHDRTAYLGCPTSELLDAMQAAENQQPLSLDAPISADHR
jgi:RNA polymerase sigma-B factor